MSAFDKFKSIFERPKPVLIFGLKVGLYKNEKIKKDEMALVVHPDNFEKAKTEITVLYEKYLAQKP